MRQCRGASIVQVVQIARLGQVTAALNVMAIVSVYSVEYEGVQKAAQKKKKPPFLVSQRPKFRILVGIQSIYTLQRRRWMTLSLIKAMRQIMLEYSPAI